MQEPSLTIHRSRFGRRLVATLLLNSLLLSSCSDAAPSIMQPRSPQAETIVTLSWFLFIAGTLVYIGVMGFMLFALFRRRRRDGEVTQTGARRGEWIIVTFGIIVPAVILLVVLGFGLWTMSAVSESNEGSEPVVIDVIGHQWWWEVHYPDYGFVTANEIHIPAGRPVVFRLASEDVIHSLWIPELMGKLDLVPGNVNVLDLEAAEPGVYLGICAEFCGIQHAKMQLVVVAGSSPSFAAWAEQQQLPAVEPRTPQAHQGQQVFLGSPCAHCHSIRGTTATGDLGPDLTHLASRRTLGAGILPNTRGHLGGWVVNSQAIKPGNLMPPSDLTSQEFNALLEYLAILK